MQVEALSKALVLYDLIDVFQILDKDTVNELTTRLEDLHASEDTGKRCDLALLADPTNAELLSEKLLADDNTTAATTRLQATTIRTQDLITSFRTLDESTIRRSNAYYARFGADHSVENLAWSADRCLNTRDNALRDKVR